MKSTGDPLKSGLSQHPLSQCRHVVVGSKTLVQGMIQRYSLPLSKMILVVTTIGLKFSAFSCVSDAR
ncbi:hypothetical protein AMTR_s00031p00093150 [Amborella trichopoda]|uniref:Uncharacterized protein n=1 Tax=Amborella trichopoda TaxID=13333 RepID=U5D2T3_AMBTC|nr:hypothetical protein AMTR_s00031p00093150 [Amborella trichopoda]